MRVSWLAGRLCPRAEPSPFGNGVTGVHAYQHGMIRCLYPAAPSVYIIITPDQPQVQPYTEGQPCDFN